MNNDKIEDNISEDDINNILINMNNIIIDNENENKKFKKTIEGLEIEKKNLILSLENERKINNNLVIENEYQNKMLEIYKNKNDFYIKLSKENEELNNKYKSLLKQIENNIL